MGLSRGIDGVVTDGLILYFDAANKRSYNGSGTDINNLMINTTGSLKNSPTFSSDNKGYLDFDGTNDHIDVSDTHLKTLISSGNGLVGEEISLEFWFKPDVVNSYDVLGGWQVSSYLRYTGNFDMGATSGQIRFNVHTTGGNSRLGSSSGVLIADEWVNIVGTYASFSYSHGTDYQFRSGMRLYKNGVQIKSNLHAGASFVNFQKFIIAQDISPTAGRNFNGKIAICKMYNKCLSATEVLQNYNVLKHRFI